ncbi:tetratricopeptide repeat protein [Euhalothece natronophila Z-M001]|uniref:Tetratricopeptide repeat protein n=1 Tax=Euhalothece natronophila Z-M001 TaxID=522448 RepID=A0A5B8NJP6_9CHRO|nr:SirB1 family protein [Euhalothece natronophila]QDZ39197.1 tetratricopeptide repeat protein [Euhalothece natronophila Z-M001]
MSLARENFAQEVSLADEEIDLAKAALYLAQEETPTLDLETYLRQLDEWAQQVQALLPEERYPLRVIQCINQVLYDDLGFVGNEENYYDPRNSFLNEVMERRTGIPITLALVYLEVARRIDFPMVGIGMPGHFLIRPEFKNAGIFVDAFHKGEVLFPEDCEQRLQEIFGQPVTLDDQFLEAVTKKEFLARMLTNLKLIYINQQDLHRALGVIERLLLIFPDAIREQRDRGLLHYQLGDNQTAIADLKTYVAHFPDASDSSMIQMLISEISQQ